MTNDESNKIVHKRLDDTNDKIDTIIGYFAEGKVVLYKNCLQSKTNDGQPATKSDIKLIYKWIFRIIGGGLGSAGAVAGIAGAIKYFG